MSTKPSAKNAPQAGDEMFKDGDRIMFAEEVKPRPGENILKEPVPKGSTAFVISSMLSRGEFWYNLTIQDANNPQRKFEAFHIREAALDFHPEDYDLE